MAADKPRADRILVVGTTPDYIAYIYEKYHNRALFLTDTSQRKNAKDKAPDHASEIVTALQQYAKVYQTLIEHLKQWRINLTGITCYDCEWLELASVLAAQLGLPYSSTESIQLSRNKLLTKQRWTERAVPCPRVARVSSDSQAIDFVESVGRPVVLKPMTGSGSELTFRCNNAIETARALGEIQEGLSQRDQSPLYRSSMEQLLMDPGLTVLAEEFIQGDEYSADFVVDGDDVQVIRTAAKLRDDRLSFGTTIAYTVPASLPEAVTAESLTRNLGDAARALGFSHAICMADFIVNDDGIVFLELTPRIGGDCLPPLIRQSCSMDTIGLALDFAEGQNPSVPGPAKWTYLTGLRLFAHKPGELKTIFTERLARDSRIREIYLIYDAGHHIILPPEDYNSWMLGYVIFEPTTNESLRAQCEELRNRIMIEID